MRRRPGGWAESARAGPAPCGRLNAVHHGRRPSLSALPILMAATALVAACGTGTSAAPRTSAPGLATSLDGELSRQIAYCAADQAFLSGQPKSATLYVPTRPSIASALQPLAPYEGDAYVVVVDGRFTDMSGSAGAAAGQLWILIPRAALTSSPTIGDTACDLEQLQAGFWNAPPNLSELGSATALPSEAFSRPG